METFTTGEVAEMFDVCGATVRKWFRLGLLSCHRIPGSTHRRIRREEIERFARENGVPIKVAPERIQ